MAYLPSGVQQAVKILITGPFGVGKTTLVSTMSEITPLRTEEVMSQASVPVDDLSGVPGKTTTTVGMDFGRRTLTDEIVLYMFGTPGQSRFQPMLELMAQGALGALVLADTRRLDQSFEVMERLEGMSLPYAVAVNHFPESRTFADQELREALDLLPDTPLVTCDARDLHSSASALAALVAHILTPDK
ncbi:signal recognition particle receptor subunit beta [Kibdelosporangium banguiense]|uniref:Signal recognition particle receptor subunit beta n=1 Tax=Kibdelosporangium banguiense TaxID=1365924 RepID=A0ABS4TY43_9PSEU|nr:signal recognition particle receptor subunit beta [Kibdelosporangium banguiense]